MREASTLTLWFDVSCVRQKCLIWIVVLRSNVVNDDCNTQAMFTAEDVLKQRSLPSALKLFSYRPCHTPATFCVLHLPENQTAESPARSEACVSVSW